MVESIILKTHMPDRQVEFFAIKRFDRKIHMLKVSALIYGKRSTNPTFEAIMPDAMLLMSNSTSAARPSIDFGSRWAWEPRPK